jgi:hypothetical protein
VNLGVLCQSLALLGYCASFVEISAVWWTLGDLRMNCCDCHVRVIEGKMGEIFCEHFAEGRSVNRVFIF